ncbi:MAG TPA: sigma-54 dependent transcriptional regulator [Candidatus Binatia bacterium]|nr:sigma-54 dependent transcriptional regulator [Candidatus Binatia bacterium]
METQIDISSLCVLFVDDEPDILETLKLGFEGRFHVRTALGGEEALAILRRDPVAVLVLDQRMPEMTGIEVARRALDLRPDIVPIILTGYTDAAALVDAINLRRIFRYVQKPWDDRDLELTIVRALEAYHLAAENARLADELRDANQRLAAENVYLRDAVAAVPHAMVGDGPGVRAVIEGIARVAGGKTTVLVTGETGTGKELVARAIHDASPRRDAMFVAVNCAALSGGILESELFGHCRGAFTGADRDRAGLLEVADKGTVFLDEVSETSVDVQAKLLRVLQEGEIRRVGENKVRKVDVRVVAASNRDLDLEVAEGRFRRDLFYRLQVFPIRVPPLRERLEDLPALVTHFLRRHCADLKRPVPRVMPEALRALQELEFPGNVRELGNLMERALINADPGEALTEVHLLDVRPERRTPNATASDVSLDAQLARAERAFIERALDASGGNKTAAARELGITYRGLIKKMKRLGMPVGVTDDAD